MLEIKSKWEIWTDDDGEMFPAFSLILTRDKESFNCSMAANNFNDGENVLSYLISMLTNLVHHAFPEMNDALFKAKKRLESLEEAIHAVKLQISVMEKNKLKEVENAVI